MLKKIEYLGDVQLLLALLIPPPQDLEHSPNRLQALHPPASGNGEKFLRTHLPCWHQY